MRNNWGGDRASYLGTEGRLRTLPIEWTDVHAPELIVALAAGRACFRADRLRELRVLLDELAAARAAAEC